MVPPDPIRLKPGKRKRIADGSAHWAPRDYHRPVDQASALEVSGTGSFGSFEVSGTGYATPSRLARLARLAAGAWGPAASEWAKWARRLDGRVSALRCVGDSVRRRQAAPDQHVGAEIRAARPHQGPCLHPKLPKPLGTTANIGKDRPRQVFRQIALDYSAICQPESNAVAVEGRGLLNAY